MSTRQTHFENIHKVPAMDLAHHHNWGLLHFPTSNWSHMEMFSEVEWKKLNANTQELVCNCRSESVLRSVDWKMDIWLIRSPFWLHKLSKHLWWPDASKHYFIGNFWWTFIETFLMSTRQTHFENIHKVPAMDLVHPRNRGLLHFPTSNWISYGDV